MSHSLKYYATITFFLISIVVQGFGELITVRRPAANRDDTEKITCMSDDEDAAFIWNYDSTDASVVVDDNFTSKYELFFIENWAVFQLREYSIRRYSNYWRFGVVSHVFCGNLSI